MIGREQVTVRRDWMFLLLELKRRNVHRMAGLYMVAAWLIVQVAETLFPLFGFDETPAR